MKKILVVCGNGIASSSIMLASLQDYLKKQGIKAELDKASLMTCTDDFFNSKDLIVSSTKINRSGINTPIIIGSGLLTGIDEDNVLERIKQEILK